MDNFYTNTTLKRMALRQLRGITFISMQVVLISFFFVYVLYILMNSLLPLIKSQPMAVAYELVCYFILALLLFFFTFGRKFFFLNVASNHPFKINDVFFAFKNYTLKAAGIGLIRAVISFVLIVCPFLFLFVMTLVGVTAYIPPANYAPYAELAEFKMMLEYGRRMAEGLHLTFTYETWAKWYSVSVIFSWLTGVVYMWLLMTLEQTERLLLYYPSRSVLALMNMSKKMMKGHKLKRFLLMLSFIPHNLISFFTFGAGYLWVIPYKELTYTNFFLDIRAHEEEIIDKI